MTLTLHLILTANDKLPAEEPLFDIFARQQKVKFLPNNAHLIENFFTYIFKPGVCSTATRVAILLSTGNSG